MDIQTAVETWLQHCIEVGHIPKAEGGKATFSYSQETGRIFCCAKGCIWESKTYNRGENI